jgi:hypothetical protein
MSAWKSACEFIKLIVWLGVEPMWSPMTEWSPDMSSITRIFFLSTTLALLAACGGGGGGGGAGLALGGGGGDAEPSGAFGFDTGVGGSGGVVGTFQGHGSIIINDRTLTTSGSEFELEGEPGLETDLKEGQQLIVVADLAASMAEHVVYRSNIKGPVSSLTVVDALTGTADLVVMGQSVRTNSTTRFSDVTFATLAANHLVEISGTFDGAGVLVATFVERETALAEYKVVGAIANIDTDNRTFAVGGLNVDYSSATLSEFGSATPADGTVVEVKVAAADFTAPSNAIASEVERLPVLVIEDTAEVEFEGFIGRFASVTDFDIAGLSVTTTGSTTFENGASSSLALNVKVEAEGTVDATGTLVATKVVIKPTEAIRVEGRIAANGIDLTNQTVTMAVGLTFTIRQLTELEDDTGVVDPLTLADLADSDFLEIRGFLDGQTLVAAELDREDDDPRTRLRGPVTDQDVANGTVEILNVVVTGVDGVTEYEDDADNTVTQAQFHAQLLTGSTVEVEWDPFISITATADRLAIEEEDD